MFEIWCMLFHQSHHYFYWSADGVRSASCSKCEAKAAARMARRLRL